MIAHHDPHVGVRYDPKSRRGHAESYFMKANDPKGRRAFWAKVTIFASDLAPDRAIAESWAVAFDAERGHVAVKTCAPFALARFASDRLYADSGDAMIRDGASKGDVASGDRRVAWDLSLTPGPSAAPFIFYNAALYATGFPRQKFATPWPDARASGEVRVNDETWNLESWPAMVGHNWGRHTDAYSWAHVNAWDGGEDTVIEAAGGRVKIGPIFSPEYMFLIVRHRGETHAFTHFSEVARKNKLSSSRRTMRFSAKNKTIRIRAELTAQTENMVGLYYAEPSGTMMHCLNSKLSHAHVEIEARGDGPRTLTSNAAALEIGTRDPAHGVKMYV